MITIDDNYEPHENTTFNDIVEAANAHTSWRYICCHQLLAVGRLENQYGWSFQADISVDEPSRQLSLQIKVADEVHHSAAAARKLILIAESNCNHICEINYDEELGTIRIRAQIDYTKHNGQLAEILCRICNTSKTLLGSEHLMGAVKIGGGKLRRIPMDLFSDKYDEPVSDEILHPQLQGEYR